MNTKTKRPAAPWWRGAFFYQVYPRSFLDTNGDGIGDLPGITQKLDYIASLGVDAIWISPFFTSPMKDFGYDVSNYKDIDPIFGTLWDFEALMTKAHALGLKVIIDLVLNHTSDQHPWFAESRKDKINPKSNWYIWSDTIPNNWVSVFGGPAWTLDETRGQYYLHNFLKEQPDLNFHNSDVHDAIIDVAKFWLDRGVDGFRLDVVNFYFHDQKLRSNPPRDKGSRHATQFEAPNPYSAQQHIYDKSQPENLEFIKRFRKLMDQYPDRMTVGEIGDDHPNERAAEYTAGNDRLNTCYNTHMMSGTQKNLTASVIREPIEKFLKQPGNGWPSWAFSNHDVVRAASRWWPEGDGFGNNEQFSKMLIALLGSLYGTVFIYQGEELGLPEAKIAYEDLQDPWAKTTWPTWQGRDGCRTPMPWQNAKNTGFSRNKPWLPIPHTHIDLNVASQEKNKNSILHFTREFLAWRKRQPALRYGDINFIDTGDEKILCFERIHYDKTITAIFNFSDQEKTFQDKSVKPNGFLFEEKN